MPSASVAVVDIGSNSIKVLIATRGTDGGVFPLAFHSLDSRIGSGISRTEPRLSEEGMTRGVEAVRSLVAHAEPFQPSRIALVATSAVRDARNGAEFRNRVHAATGHEIRILSGEEEANLIGRGLTCDAALRDVRDFYVFDLGGGSLEGLAFRDRRIEQAVSLQLGCVRLTEQFVPDPNAPFTAASQAQITQHTRDVFESSDFKFSLPEAAVAVGTGGTVTTVRTILGAREAKSFEATSPVVTTAQLRELLNWIGPLPLAERKRISGLPAARADVFPTALATLIAVADLGGIAAFRNSLYNLRYGVADELLSAMA
jgi:exopolyphosphatase/guanosine-5'-triphosphate,3'-diphosphate pyrophosphatase